MESAVIYKSKGESISDAIAKILDYDFDMLNEY
jgi:hypothetical protein